MVNAPAKPRSFGDPLLRAIVLTFIVLAVVHAALKLYWGTGPMFAVLPWFPLMASSFLALCALAIAFLAFGRYLVFREPAPFWVGVAFMVAAIVTVFSVLSFPGVLPEGRSFIARLPDTSVWIGILQQTLLAIFLLLAAVMSWPAAGKLEPLWFWILLAAVMAFAATAASLLLIFEQFLPTALSDNVFSTLTQSWRYVAVLLYGASAVLSTYRYRQTGDGLFGYVALFSVILVFSRVAGLLGERRYDLWWYSNVVISVASYAAMLFGLLSEYVQLYRRELDKTHELELLREGAQRHAAQLQAILDNMVDSVFVCDLEGHIVMVNKAGVRLLGISGPEDVQRHLTDLLEHVRLRGSDGTPVEPQKMVLARALAGESVVQEDEIIYNPQMQRDIYIRSSAAPIRDEKGEVVGAVAVTRDITELTELDRLKDQFIAVAAHELKTPVTGVKGYAQFLLRREHEGVSPVGLKALEAINRQTDRISRLVNELLEISRIQTGRLELRLVRLDLSQLTGEAVERMKIATEKHRLLFQSPGPVFVSADADRIEQVLDVLLDNAIKYSPQDGDIETTVRAKDGEAVVSVRDHGVGIPKDKHVRIFERFYRAHTGTPYDYGGMGVGLFISRETITRHGGKMWFESEEGKGSTFYFSLPLA